MLSNVKASTLNLCKWSCLNNYFILGGGEGLGHLYLSTNLSMFSFVVTLFSRHSSLDEQLKNTRDRLTAKKQELKNLDEEIRTIPPSPKEEGAILE